MSWYHEVTESVSRRKTLDLVGCLQMERIYHLRLCRCYLKAKIYSLSLAKIHNKVLILYIVINILNKKQHKPSCLSAEVRSSPLSPHRNIPLESRPLKEDSVPTLPTGQQQAQNLTHRRNNHRETSYDPDSVLATEVYI